MKLLLMQFALFCLQINFKVKSASGFLSAKKVLNANSQSRRGILQCNFSTVKWFYEVSDSQIGDVKFESLKHNPKVGASANLLIKTSLQG